MANQKKKNLGKTSVILLGMIIMSPSIFAQQKNKKVLFIDKENMDLSVKPGDDFNTYANGTWLKNNPVPPKQVRWGSFIQLREFNIQAVKVILEDAVKKNAPGASVEKRVADFYSAGMDTVSIEKAGFSPIANDLNRIDAIKDLSGILNEAAYLRTIGAGSPFFGFYVGQDKKNPDKMVTYLSQGGTTLPDRDYYLKSDPATQKIQESYKEYIFKLFTYTGAEESKALKYSESIFNFEKKLAEQQMSRVEMRDPHKTYNKFSTADFNKETSRLDWNSLLIKMKAGKQDTVLVNNPDFFRELNRLIAEVSLDEMKTYLKWNILKNSAHYLSSPFVTAAFAFDQILTGQKELAPRWERISQQTDRNIGDLLGQLYVEKHFNPEAKARMDELIKNLIRAYEIRIKNLEWMSAETKEKALEKLYAFTPKIGYPEKWKTYEGLDINANNYFQNVKNANSWNYDYMIDQLGKPVDRKKFGMTPPTVNAYYNPVNNEIVFPAGILQFPFFDPEADDAINYGGIGAVIGHEISHGFDDSGCKYDKDGYLRNWWKDEDFTRFEAKAKSLQEQFDAYTVLDTLHVNGKFTLGENIGDLGGLNAAYEAFKMTKQGQSKELIDGFTPDQRFFLSWAQVWRTNILPENAARLIITDPHSPGMYRVIGAPVNMDAWYEAFDVKEGDKLYKKPEDRIRIW